MRNIFSIVLVAMVAISLYFRLLDYQFVGDDQYQILRSDLIKSVQNLPQLFQKSYLSKIEMIKSTSRFYSGSGEMSYRPVCTLSYMFDYRLWGLDPRGYHLTNLILHFICVVLVYFLALNLGLKQTSSCIAALIFLLHPVNSEVVSVITSRDDSLAFLFFGGAFLFYLGFKRSGYRNKILFLFSLLLYGFAMFAKEMAVTLPLIILLYDLLFPVETTDAAKNQGFKSRIKYYFGYLAVAAFYFWIWFFIMTPSREGILSYSWTNGFVVLATIINILAKYMVWLVAPVAVPAAISDPRVIVTHPQNWQFIQSVLLVVAVIVFVGLAYFRKNKTMLFAFFWFILTILPVLNLTKMFGVLYAARFLYIPMIGFCLLVAIVWQQRKNIIIRSLILALLVFYSAITYYRLPIWEDNLTLAMDRLVYFPQNTIALIDAGAACEEKEIYDSAIAFYKEAIYWDPQCADCYNQLGVLYRKLGKLDLAAEMFAKVKDFQFTPSVDLLNYCNSLGEKKLFVQAEACFQEIIDAQPMLTQARYNLGVMYVQAGRKKEAVEVWNSALLIEPENQLLIDSLEKLKKHD